MARRISAVYQFPAQPYPSPHPLVSLLPTLVDAPGSRADDTDDDPVRSCARLRLCAVWPLYQPDYQCSAHSELWQTEDLTALFACAAGAGSWTCGGRCCIGSGNDFRSRVSCRTGARS